MAGVWVQSAIVWKNLWVAPEITGAISDVADKLPNLLEVSTQVPWIGSVSSWVIDNVPLLNELSWDISNSLNVGTYMSAIWIVYFLAKWSWWKKWKMEAFWSSVVWTAVSWWLFLELLQYIQWNWSDILWYLPKNFYESLPESVDDFLDHDGRQIIQWWIAALWTAASAYMVKKNVNIIKWKTKEHQDEDIGNSLN